MNEKLNLPEKFAKHAVKAAPGIIDRMAKARHKIVTAQKPGCQFAFLSKSAWWEVSGSTDLLDKAAALQSIQAQMQYANQMTKLDKSQIPALWALSKGIYRLGPKLVESLQAAPWYEREDASIDLLGNFKEWCIYLELPDQLKTGLLSNIDGCFVAPGIVQGSAGDGVQKCLNIESLDKQTTMTRQFIPLDLTLPDIKSILSDSEQRMKQFRELVEQRKAQLGSNEQGQKLGQKFLDSADMQLQLVPIIVNFLLFINSPQAERLLLKTEQTLPCKVEPQLSKKGPRLEPAPRAVIHTLELE